MAEHLIIRLLSAGGDLAEWVVVDDAGACRREPERGPLADAAIAAIGRRTWFMVPAASVLSVRAELPVRGAGRISQALPFALEDLLADDVDELHFAAGPRGADRRVTAAVVRIELMDRWLALAHGAGLEPLAVVTEADGLAEVPNTATLLVEPEQSILRVPGGEVVAGDTASVTALLDAWLSAERQPTPEGALQPRHLLIYVVTTMSAGPWERFRARTDSLEVRQLGDTALPRLAAGVVTLPVVNLLQGAYAKRSSLSAIWPQWRVAAALLAGVVVAGTAVAGAEAWRLRRESDALAETIAQAARYAFPDAPDLSQPRALLEQSLEAQAGPAPGSAKFLDTLQSVAAAVAATREARLEAVNYRTGIIDLQIRAPSADSLDRIRQQVVDGAGLKAEIQSANADGDQIEGRIRISAGGA